MDFWQFIDSHTSRPFSIETTSESIETALRKLEESEVLAYCHAYSDAMDKAYTWDLWGIAYLFNGGCGDDSFMDFRSNLIALGREAFDRALSDPESLLDIQGLDHDELFEEGLLYVGPTVYESLSGKPSARKPAPDEPTGKEWSESREDLMVRYPKAWAKYGWEETLDVYSSEKSKRPWWKFW